MDLLKKFFPFSFTPKKDVAALVINVVIMIVIGFVIGLVIGLLSGIPVLGWIIGILGSLVDLYVTASIVLSFLHYFKVLK